MESKADEADSLMDMSQTLLQLLGSAMPSGSTLLSPLLLAQAASGSLVPAAAAAAQMSLPWMLPAQYQQFVVLQQGLAQQLLVPGVGECHDGQGEMATDKTGNQLEATAEANPLLAAILQRHSMNQRQLQKLDDSDRNATAISLSPNCSLLTTGGLPLQSVQFEGLSGQTGMWPTGNNDKVQERRQQQQQQSQQLQQQRPRPPKKPLTPYMIFSKEIWHQVKAANSHLSSVTEIGAIIGRLWRDLDAEKKEQYNEMFNENKVRYDEEMRVYLRKNNLRPSDLIRSKTPRRHNSPSSSHSGFTKSHHETTKQLALGGRSHDLFNSSDQNFYPGQSVQQLLGQMGFSGETVFPSGIAVSNNSSVIGQTQNQINQGTDELVHVSTISPSVSSENLGKSVNSTETTTAAAAWTWHQPVSLDNDSHRQTTETGVTLTEASSAAKTQARYYNAQGLDQLLKLKEQNMDRLHELAHINDLEMQILHLESSLKERTQKVDELRQELDAANLLIAHLHEQQQQQQQSTTSQMDTVDDETSTNS